MASANILINGSTPPILNVVYGASVTLSNAINTGVTSWLWQIVDKPTGSVAVLSSTSVPSPSVTLDKEGTYLFKLTVNGGGPSGTAIASVASLLTGIRLPAAYETFEADSSRGWTPAANAAFSSLETSSRTGAILFASATAAFAAGTPLKISGESTLANGQKVLSASAASASASATLPAVGVAIDSAAASGDKIRIRTSGPLTEVTMDTSLGTVGAPVYVSNAGALSLTAGTVPTIIGYVATVSLTGHIYVLPSSASSQWISSGADIYFTGGSVGIGTTTPTTTLDVAGLVRSSSGGFKFPDNTIQTTAASNRSTGGWLVVSDVTASGGTTSSKVYQDTGNTVLRSLTTSTSSVNVSLKASYPKVLVNGVTNATLAISADGGHYTGTVAATAAGGPLPVKLIMPDGTDGYADNVTITVDAPPTILTLAFTGGYPGSQTELKAGDTFQVSGTTDKPTTGVQVSDFGVGAPQIITFGSTTSFTVSITIADRGNSAQSLAARLQAKDASGAYGATFDTTNTVVLNNLHPTLTFGTITYPVSQAALKGSEDATIVVTSANLNTIVYDSPTGELGVTNPTTIESPKTVTRQSGGYNVSVNNFRGIATRAANAATTTTQTIIKIADDAAVITVAAPAARLRSGGNNGTAVQSHTITITSTQQLLSAPSLSADTSGTFIGSWSGGPTVYTRTFQVHDNDIKGTYNWQSLSATNLAGTVTTSITSGGSYVLGGFVSRTLTFSAFSQLTTLNVAVVTYAKLTAGIFTATNQPALLNAAQGNHSNIANTYTVEALNTNPTSIYWNDNAAASSNSGGTAQITNVQETV